MKTAEEILKNNTGHAHGLMDAMVIKSMKEFALEVAKEALKNAANKARLSATRQELSAFQGTIDKESILSETNTPKL